MKKQPQQHKINVKLDQQVGEGIYSNFFLITNSPSEFVLDFGRMVPGVPNAKIYSRIITTPQHAKQLQQLLEKNIAAYENKFGEIKATSPANKEKVIGFKSEGQSS
ncbi:MAG TPA: DUF3467 domain-containing protein [Candidatus Cloacimonas sp.]|jgi:hypothetical protein|nr:hypothetical protein [Candidatus Cloacimonadota bacterium]HCX73304.1 DUF3467 domain-containing protein [Candidatus Cloacimonas sp.]